MSFTGLIAEIPLGTAGLTGRRNQSLIPPTQLIEALNISYEGDELSKEGGAAKYNSTAISGGPEIYGGWDWHPSAGVQRIIVVCSDGKIYKDDGGGSFSTTLASGISVTDKSAVFIEGGVEAAGSDRKLFILTGSNAIQVLTANGATTSAIANGAADWTGTTQPMTGCVHEGRLWMGLGHTVYYSLPGDHEDFTDASAGSIQVFPGVGREIFAITSFKGLLIIFKYPKGIYAVDTSDSDTSNWRAYTISESIGIRGRRAFALIDDDIIFQEAGGEVNLLTAVTQFGNLGTQSLSSATDMNDFIHKNTYVNLNHQMAAVFYADKREVHISQPSTSSADPDRRLVIDYNHPAQPRWRFSDRDTILSLWLQEDGASFIQKPAYGDDSGFVWNMDETTKSKDGAAYDTQARTPDMDLGFLDPSLATRRKRGKALEATFRPIGNWDISVDIYWDGAYHSTVTFNQGTTGAVLGSFVLGTDALAGDISATQRKRVTGSGHRVGFRVKQNSAGQDLALQKLYFYFNPTNQSIR